MTYISHRGILFLILRKIDAMQQVFISYCENKFQHQNPCLAKFKPTSTHVSQMRTH